MILIYLIIWQYLYNYLYPFLFSWGNAKTLPANHHLMIDKANIKIPSNQLTQVLWGKVQWLLVQKRHISNTQESQIHLFLQKTHWLMTFMLTNWGRVTHICVSKITIIGSDNDLSPDRRQAIIWTNVGILLIQTIGTNFSEKLSDIHTFSFKKMHLKMSSAKWRPFCLGLNVLTSGTYPCHKSMG